MTIANGINKELRYKAEVTYGTAPSATGAQMLRRTESTIDLSKDTYQSGEIRTDQQIADFRHGVRRVGGNIKGELSPGTYADFIAAALRKAFAAVSAITGLSLTIAGSGPYTVTRGSGSFITDGVKVGDVVRITAGSVAAGNLNNNILVTTLTALVITGITLNASALTAEGPIASCTVAVVGKKCYTPTTSHTNASFSIEHYYSDLSKSELFTGCKVNTIDIALPPTGMATIDMAIVGKDITTGTAEYYTTPTAATSTGIVAAVNGVVMLNGTQSAVVTGLSLKIEDGITGDPVVGSNTINELFRSPVKVSGQFTAYFDSTTMRDAFIAETEITLVVVLTADNSNAADFIAFSLPRVKIGSATKDDGDKGLVATHTFTALYNSAGGAATTSEQTTLVVQDSDAA